MLSEGPPDKKQKQAVCRKTVEKWSMEKDRTLNTAVRLKFKTDRCDHMLSLKVVRVEGHQWPHKPQKGHA